MGALLAVSLVSIAPAPAAAWSNGVGDPDGYGTHDWILRHAVEAAGSEATWVRLRVALRATDDPDTVNGIDHASGPWWQVWDVWGDRYGAAPDAIRVWFERTRARLRAGNRRGASRALGILAHLVGDIAQPMHTDGWLRLEERVHGNYEAAVDRRIRRSAGAYRFTDDGVAPGRPGPVARLLGRQAHRSYEVLVRGYAANGYSGRVHRITQRQLDRAANALADLLVAL